MFIWVSAVYKQRAFPSAQVKYAQKIGNQNRIPSKQKKQRRPLFHLFIINIS